MSLQYKIEHYLRKAMREAEITQIAPGIWAASQASFGLRVIGDSRDQAELKLYAALMVQIVGSRESGARLPIMDDIDLNITGSASGPASERMPAATPPEADDQEWFWTEEWQAGEQEASADIAAERVEIYDSASDFVASFPD